MIRAASARPVEPHGAGRVIVLGVGLRAACPADVLIDLVDELLASQDIAAADLCAIATLDRRAGAPGVDALRRWLARPVFAVPARALAGAEHRLLSHSRAARQHLGVASVAEAAALIVADRGCRTTAAGDTEPAARLFGPRRTNPQASAALAWRLVQRYPAG